MTDIKTQRELDEDRLHTVRWLMRLNRYDWQMQMELQREEQALIKKLEEQDAPEI